MTRFKERGGAVRAAAGFVVLWAALSVLLLSWDSGSVVEASHPHAFPINRVRQDDYAHQDFTRVRAIAEVDAKEEEERKKVEELAQQIETVHVIFMNHLDVGYNGINPEVGFAYNVINKYFDVYYPAAINTSMYLRSLGGPERLIYTSHPWLVDLYLDCPPNMNLHCPNQTAIAAFIAAVQRGDITWQAGPFNLQPENMDPILFTFGLSIAQNLSNTLNVSMVKTLSQRDVPGMTRGVVPLLASFGVEAVSVGVNPDTSPPAVPKAFVWRDDPSGSEVLAMWHPGGYPNNPGPNATYPGGLSIHDCVIVEGLNAALAFAFRTDNSGPPSAEEVISNFALLQAEFPQAQIVASRFDDFVTQLQTVRETLPVVVGEIGDTWVLGIASDPWKEAIFREISRARVDCLNSGVCSESDYVIRNFSRLLIKIPEHTWGLPGVYDDGNWTNVQFNAARKGSNYVNCTLAWLEQRSYLEYAFEALGDHPLAADIANRLTALKPTVPSLDGFSEVNKTETQNCGSITIGFDHTGTIVYLYDSSTKINWATENAPWAEFIYTTFNNSDFNLVYDDYEYGGYTPGYQKTNVSEANPIHAAWRPILINLYRSDSAVNDTCTFLVNMQMPPITYLEYGAPSELWEEIIISPGSPVNISINLQWFHKTSTRLPESFMFAFRPSFDGWNWEMDKLGTVISPMEVILNGSQHQHAIWSGITYSDSQSSSQVVIKSLDVPLVSPGPETPMPVPLTPLVELPYGMAFNIYNNIWDTNYILWYPYIDSDADALYRFQLLLS